MASAYSLEELTLLTTKTHKQGKLFEKALQCEILIHKREVATGLYFEEVVLISFSLDLYFSQFNSIPILEPLTHIESTKYSYKK